MCTVLIGFQVHPVYPIIVAANRDEYLHRESQGPGLLSSEPWVVGGRDLMASGTWLGLNRWGVVGLTNQPSGGLAPADCRSRGLLVLDALKAADAGKAIHLADLPGGAIYQPYNLFAVDADALFIAYHRGDSTRVQPLLQGWHVIPNGEADNRRIPKVGRAFDLLGGLTPALGPDDLAARLRGFLADHLQPGDPPDEPGWLPEPMRRAVSSLCVHSQFYGTKSYSILMAGGTQRARYWHGEGAPCTAPMFEVDLESLGAGG